MVPRFHDHVPENVRDALVDSMDVFIVQNLILVRVTFRVARSVLLEVQENIFDLLVHMKLHHLSFIASYLFLPDESQLYPSLFIFISSSFYHHFYDIYLT